MRRPAISNQITNAQPSGQRAQPHPRCPATRAPCLQRGQMSGVAGARAAARALAGFGGGRDATLVGGVGAVADGERTTPAPPRIALTTSLTYREMSAMN